MATKAQAKFAPGVDVEVWRIDFSVGPAQECQHVWMRGTVDRVEEGVGSNPKLITVFARMADGGWAAEIVGPRGGNNKIRVV